MSTYRFINLFNRGSLSSFIYCTFRSQFLIFLRRLTTPHATTHKYKKSNCSSLWGVLTLFWLNPFTSFPSGIQIISLTIFNIGTCLFFLHWNKSSQLFHFILTFSFLPISLVIYYLFHLCTKTIPRGLLSWEVWVSLYTNQMIPDHLLNWKIIVCITITCIAIIARYVFFFFCLKLNTITIYCS